VTFTEDDGSSQDLTDYFESGDYLTLAVPGTLSVCPGTWWARVLLRADIAVVGLGSTPGDTVLSGGESGTIIDVAGPDVAVSISNVRLDRGAGLDVEHNSGGGGVYCEQDGAVTITDTLFTDNTANDGAGLYARDCLVTIAASSFEDNVSEDDGGALTLWTSTATLSDVQFLRNTSLDGGAAALFDSQVSASNVVFSDNTGANLSGGVWSHQTEAGLSMLTLTDATFSGNVNNGSSHYGGGLIVVGAATLTRVTFTGNSAALGGGLYVEPNATVDGTDCDFSGNTPDDIYASTGSGGGSSYTAGSGYSFSCSGGSCTER